MPSLKRVVEQSDTPLGKAFDLTIQFLIVFSIITLSVETLPNLSERTQYWLSIAEYVTVAIFTLEYLLRIYVADSKPRFIFSFFGLVDFFAILPFYLAIGLDLRGLRAMRLLRLVLILKFARYSAATARFHRAFVLIREELLLFFFVTTILLFLTAVGIYHFEKEAQPETFASIFHSLWWSMITLTTVGYGDVYPVTLGGRIFTFFVLIIGLGIVALPAGLIAAALSQARDEEVEADKASKRFRGQ